jgi:hypothetical protein
MIRQNLEVSEGSFLGELVINQVDWFRGSIAVSAKENLLLVSALDLYLVLKSYVANEAVVVEKLFVASTSRKNANASPTILTPISLFEIRALREYIQFLEWHEVFLKKM